MATLSGITRSARLRLFSLAQLPAPELFVWAVWGLMLLAGLAFVRTYGRNCPFWDEWAWVPAQTGEVPFLPWLWEQHNEHRLPLPKLLFVALCRLTGWDYRAGMYVNVVALGGLAAGFLLVARRLRGATYFADAFFPLALLNWGQHESFLMGSQVAFTVPVLFLGTFLGVILHRPQLSGRAAVLAGGCVLGLPLCGMHGLLSMPALGGWLLWVIVRQWRPGDPGGRPARVAAMLLTLAGFMVAGLYPLGLHAAHPPSPGLRATVQTFFQFLAMSFGSGAEAVWKLTAAAATAALLASVVLLLLTGGRQPEERPRALGLLAFLAALVAVAGAVGWGRASQHALIAGLASRYTTLAVPGVCCVYFIWELYGGRRLRTLVQLALFSLTCSLVALNVQDAQAYGRARRDNLRAFEHDLRSGVPAFVLAERHAATVFRHPEALARGLVQLQQAGFRPFLPLCVAPHFREVPLAVEPALLEEVTWAHQTAHGAGSDSRLTFALPSPTFVHAIRLRCRYDGPETPPARLRLTWPGPDEDAARTYRIAARPKPADETVTIWVNATIDRFHLEPNDRPFSFRLTAITLLVPVD